jgi:serine protease
MSETESNNTISTGNVVSTSGTTVNGTMGSSTDTDYFKVTVPAGKTLSATLTPNSTSDYDLYIYNSAGTQVTSSTNGTGAVDSASASNTGTTAVTAYVRVSYYSGGTGSTSGKYTLKLSW